MSSENLWSGAAAGVIAASSVIMLAGCAGATNAPTAVPRPSPTQAASPTQAVSPSEPVKNPRDVTALSRRPCEFLTAQQATGFRLELPPDQLTGLNGTLRCMWTTTTPVQREIVRMVHVSMSTDKLDFAATYERDRGLPFVELTDIAGYPAIVTRANATLPICTIKVKAADRQSVSVSYEDKELNKDPQQSCQIGKQVAAAVVTNLPPQS